jgi:hypothetical protein
MNDAVLTRFGQTLGKIVTGIEGGLFPVASKDKETRSQTGG